MFSQNAEGNAVYYLIILYLSQTLFPSNHVHYFWAIKLTLAKCHVYFPAPEVSSWLSQSQTNHDTHRHDVYLGHSSYIIIVDTISESTVSFLRKILGVLCKNLDVSLSCKCCTLGVELTVIRKGFLFVVALFCFLIVCSLLFQNMCCV